MTNSLRDTLRAALNREWERDDLAHKAMEQPQTQPQPPRTPFQVTNNLSRAAFEYIRDNPGHRKDINAALVAAGYQMNSVSSIIGQMLRQGMVVVGSDSILRAMVNEYRPLKSVKTLRNQQPKRKRPVSSGGIASIPLRSPVPVAAVPAEKFVSNLLESMSILQARAVYDELRKIFGDYK